MIGLCCDGMIVSGAGGTTALDLAASLVTEHCGKARALKGLVSLLVDKHRAAHHMPHRPNDHLAGRGDWRVEQSIELMERNVSRPFRIEELAGRLGSFVRELNRAFAHHARSSPAAVWRKLRLSHGHWLLLNTSRTVTQIAYVCGFTDAAHFSRWFRRTYAEAPNAFRVQRKQISRFRPS